MSQIKFEVVFDEKNATATINKVSNSVQEMKSHTEKASTHTKSFGSSLLKLAAAAGGAYAAIRVASNTIKAMWSNAIEAERVSKNLSASLEMTGRGGAEAANHFEKFATAVQRETIYSDEAIKSASTLLIQLTSLSTQGIEKATKASIGLASVMGVDLNSAAMLIAKAMEGNVGALSRYGFKIDETLPKEEALAKLLDEIAGLYGRATAEVNTTFGALEQLKNVWGDTLEAAGKAITENEEFISSIKNLSASLIEFTESEQFTNFFGTLSQLLTTAIERMERAINVLTKFDETIRNFIKGGDYITKTSKEWLEIYTEFDPVLNRVIKVAGKADVKLQELTATEKNEIDINKGGIPIRQKSAEQIKKEAEELKKLRDRIQGVVDQADPAAKKQRELNQVMSDTYRAVMQEKLGFEELILVSIAVGKLRPLEPMLETVKLIPVELEKTKKGLQEILNLSPQVNEMPKSWLESFTEFFISTSERLTGFIGLFQSALGIMDSAFSQSQKNREIKLDNEYKKRLQRINQTVSNEEERAKLIMALDAEYDLKRRALQHSQAKKQKAFSLAQAIINVHEAITKALAQGGAILGPIMAAVVAAAGAVQIKAIMSQPVPLARGAVFEKPTEFLTSSGGHYLAGEAGTEILLPERRLRDIIRSEISPREGLMNITMPIEIQFGSSTIRREMVAAVNLAAGRGELRLPAERVLV